MVRSEVRDICESFVLRYVSFATSVINVLVVWAMNGAPACHHSWPDGALLTLMESTRSSTRNRRLTSAMVLLSLARTMSLYLCTISSDSATSSSRYCLKEQAEKPLLPSDWLRIIEPRREKGDTHLNGCPSSDFWMACRMPLYILKLMVTDRRARPM